MKICKYSETCVNQISLRHLHSEYKGASFIQVKPTKISYIGTLFKFSLYRILFYPGFSFDRLTVICIFGSK
jgi:hypothetical protein